MPKYRLLTHEELVEFEKEFVDYLVVNGIIADEWVNIKEKEPKKAVEIIGLFSDVIFEETMRNIQYMEARTKKEVQCFHCTESKLIMMAMKVGSDNDVDFTDQSSMDKAMQNPPADIEVYTMEKEYSESREEELFKMTQLGCTIADGNLYKALSLALAESKEV